jgi:hypothetical protein
MHGGRSRYSCSSAFQLSLSILLGPHFKERITGSIKTVPTISHRFIRPKYSAARHTRFSGQNQPGGPHGFYFRPLYWFYGPRRAFG